MKTEDGVYEEIPKSVAEGVEEVLTKEVEDTKEVEVSIPEGKQRALSDGWVDKDDWVAQGKDPDDWTDWRQFNRAGDLMRTIQAERRERKKDKEEFKLLIEEQRRLAEKQLQKEREELIASFKQKKIEAMRVGDYEQADIYDDEVQKLRTEEKRTSTVPKQKEVEKTQEFWDDVQENIFNKYIEANSWYRNDEDTRDYFDVKYMKLFDSLKDKDPDFTAEDLADILAKADKLTKSAFPHKFKPAATARVESGTSPVSSGKSSKYTERHLTTEQRRVAQAYVNQGVMTMQQYVDALAQMGEIK